MAHAMYVKIPALTSVLRYLSTVNYLLLYIRGNKYHYDDLCIHIEIKSSFDDCL